MSSRHIRGPLVYRNTTVHTAAGDVTVTNESQVIVNKASGAATAVNLPDADALLVGQTIIVKDGKGDAATNNITVTPAAAGTIDGASTYVLSQNFAAAAFTWNGSEWGVTSLGSSGSSGTLLANAITGTDSSLGITGIAGTGTGGAGGAIVGTGGAATAHTTGTGGAGGAVSLVGGAAGTATTGTGGAGGATAITGTAGGAASAAAGVGGAGGAATVTAGVGGASSHASGGAGGAGGAASLIAGAGGAAAGTGTAGAGGAVVLTAGAGGAKTGTGAAAGGAGGSFTMTAGVGGATASSGANNGGAGGSYTLTAGAGGAASAGTGNGGAGGSITLTPGAGGATTGGAAGARGRVKVSGSIFAFGNAQTIDMADAAVVLTLVPGTPAGTNLTSNVLFVDPNSGQATENLDLPPEADCNGLVLFVMNTGGEGIVVRSDGGGTIITLDTAQHGLVACDGTTWFGFMGNVT